MKLLIVEPWFTGLGHPAQSLINTASAIGRHAHIDYLVSFVDESEFFIKTRDRLSTWGRVIRFRVSTHVGSSNTVRALLSIVGLRLRGRRYQRIFFFDATLPIVALLWPWLSWLIGTDRISILHLHGPEVIGGGQLGRFMVRRLLLRKDVYLYLRTEELAQVWRAEFSGEIRSLPSLEIPGPVEDHLENEPQPETPTHSASKIKFGILGQIRPGKGIDWLVPLFKKHPEIGDLLVAGSFFDQRCRDELPVLKNFAGFSNRFLPEDEMLNLAGDQDYLLMLYGQGWDPRLESAVLYLAARVNKPVIVYEGGWSGRMVKQYGSGLLFNQDNSLAEEMLRHVPRPGTDEYSKLLNGVHKFKKAHSVKSLRQNMLDELFL